MHYVLICFIVSLSDSFLHKYSTHKYECVWMKILLGREIQITIFSELQNVTKNKKRRVSFYVSERDLTFCKTYVRKYGIKRNILRHLLKKNFYLLFYINYLYITK